MRRFRFHDEVELFQFLTGCFCIGLALIAAAGWLFRFPLLAEIHSGFVPMMPNTGFGFLIIGLIYFCHVFSFRKTGAFLTALLFLLGAVTFAEYLFGWELGVDDLLMPSGIPFAFSHSGRMAPTTALCFMLLAAAFFAIRFFHEKIRFVASGSLGSILIGLGGISLAGYVNGAGSIYIWGMFTTMAVHTAFGLLIVGIMLIYEAWRRGSQLTPLILVVSTGLMFSVQVFHVLRYQQQTIEMDFMSRAEDRVAVFRRQLAASLQMMDSLKAFFESSTRVDKNEFAQFVKNPVASSRTLYAVDWIPRVPEAGRDAFLQEARAAHPGFSYRIRERNERHEEVSAGARDEYYPILYSEPSSVTAARAGYDFGSEPVRRLAMARAAETGRAAAVLQGRRLDSPDEVFNVVLLNPVFKNPDPAGGGSAKSRLEGFVAGNFYFGSMFEDMFSRSSERDIDMSVYDATDPENEKFLFSYDTGLSPGGRSGHLSSRRQTAPGPFSYEEAIPAGDRILKFVCVPSAHYPRPLSSALPWIVSFAVAFFVLLIGQYLSLLISRDRVIQKTVQERTDELSKVNQILSDEIAQRRLIEQELRQSRSFFKTMIDNLPVAVFAKSARSGRFGIFELWNQKSESIFGLRQDQMLGKTDYDIFPKDQADFFREKDQQVFRDRNLVEIPSEPIDTPAGRRYLHTLKVPVWDENKNPLYLLGISEDITDRVKTEFALRESEERFREAFANSAIGMALVSLDGRWIQVNAVMCRILGYSEEELLKTDFQHLTYPEDLQLDLENVRRLLAGEIRSYHMEKRYMRKNGEAVWCQLSASLVRDHQGLPQIFVAQVQDIDEQKKARQELQQKSAELARSNRELEEFAYVASHDLQEPLRKIISFSRLLEEKEAERLDAESLDYLQRVVSGAGRMRHLIEDLLTYSRVMRKQLPFSEVDLNEVVKNVISDLEIRILETEARVTAGPMPRVFGDPVQLHQLFLNLVGNALKFRKKDEVPVIEITAEALQKGFYEIRIKDSGIGFDEKYLDRIFVPFQRLHTRSEYEGTGIGLSVCQKIIQRHGGVITARSRPGEGAVFIFTLPAVP